MAKIITEKSKIDELLTRGVENIYPDRKKLEAMLASGKRIRLYCGYDPSAPALHIGNAITINKMSQFQDLGHEVIFLIGDFTGMIGDPTDKSATRKKLTRAEVLKNAKNYKKQASAYLKFNGSNPAKVLHNSKWSDKINFKDLVEITSNFTVQQMIQRDMFQKRMEEGKPIYFHEFLYPIAQGYDSVAMNVDLEVGGNDQMFNMMVGRDLLRAMKNKEKFVMTLKLLADDAGKKMGKTEGNAVFLDETPENMFGIIMTWPDGVIASAFELCTKVPMARIEEIKKDLKAGKNPRDSKMELAFEITKINHGEKAAQKAKDYFVNTFQKKEAPAEVRILNTQHATRNIVDLLADTGLALSKSEAKRLVEQGGIKVDEQTIKNPSEEIKINEKGILLQRGKRQFVRIIRN